VKPFAVPCLLFVSALHAQPLKALAPAATPARVRSLLVTAPRRAFVEKPYAWAPLGKQIDDTALRVIDPLPPGMSWNAKECQLEGVPTFPGQYPLILRTGTAPGDTLRMTLEIVRNQPPVVTGTPPLMSLGNAWAFQPSIKSAYFPNSQLALSFGKSNGSAPEGMVIDTESSSLVWSPQITLPPNGVPVVLCARDPLGDSTCTSWEVPVKPFETKANEAPHFLSFLEDSVLFYEQGARYRPIAITPNGQPVHLRAILPKGSPLVWTGTYLVMPSRTPGTHNATIVAVNEQDQETTQEVAWTVNPPAAQENLAWFEASYENGPGLWSLGINLGMVRLGLFTPSITRLVGWRDREDMQLPYLLLGMNLLDEEESKLSFDAGFTLRSPVSQLYTGGAVTRLQGSFTWHAPILWKSDFEMTGYVDQAILMTDSTGTRTVHLYGTGSNDPKWNLNEVQSYRNSWWPAMRKALADQNRRDNAVVFARVDLQGQAIPWLWTGPLLELETRPLLNEIDPILGWGAKIDYSFGKLHIYPAARLGWGMENGLAAFVSLKLEG